MKNNFTQEIIVSVILIVLLVLLINPFNFWMPNMMSMTIVTGLIVLFAIFAKFIWKENFRDEREEKLNMMIGRLSSIVGFFFVILGIVIQSFNHSIDVWLVIALGAMIITKVIGLIYSRLKK